MNNEHINYIKNLLDNLVDKTGTEEEYRDYLYQVYTGYEDYLEYDEEMFYLNKEEKEIIEDYIEDLAEEYEEDCRELRDTLESWEYDYKVAVGII